MRLISVLTFLCSLTMDMAARSKALYGDNLGQNSKQPLFFPPRSPLIVPGAGGGLAGCPCGGRLGALNYPGYYPSRLGSLTSPGLGFGGGYPGYGSPGLGGLGGLGGYGGYGGLSGLGGYGGLGGLGYPYGLGYSASGGGSKDSRRVQNRYHDGVGSGSGQDGQGGQGGHGGLGVAASTRDDSVRRRHGRRLGRRRERPS